MSWSDRIAALQKKRDEINDELGEAMKARDERVAAAYERWRTYKGSQVVWEELGEVEKDAWREAIVALDIYDAEHKSEEPEQWVDVPGGSIEALNAEHLATERSTEGDLPPGNYTTISDSPFVERG